MNTPGIPLDDDELDLREFFLRLWADKWRVIWLVLAGAIIAGAIGFLMTPVYRAAAVMVSATPDRSSLSSALGSALGSLNNLASLAGVNVGGNEAAVEEALAVMRSRKFTEDFIRDNNLLPVLFSGDWDGVAKKWTVPPQDQPTMGEAFKRFDKDIREISRDKKTGLVTLIIDWRDRQQAADWANQLVARLNTEMRARAMAQSDASLQYLKQELTSTQVVDTREAINRLIESQIRQRMIASVTQEFAFRVVDVAMKPEPSDKVRPKKALMIILGGLIGGFIGVLWVYFRAPSA
jgi:LPS O-antigen subunit length determinant protein (WzzB/FepE family)